MPLRELQHSFAKALLRNEAAPVEHAPVEHAMAAHGRVSRAERFSVYHHNVTGNLTDALGGTFSATRKLAGDEFFRAMAKAFIPRHLPCSGDMNRYGGDFPAFIGQYGPAQSLPYLADVARFEWQWNASFLAADDAALAPGTLTRLSPVDYPGLRLFLRNSARLLASDYPVDRIWRFCEGEGQGQPPDIEEGCVFLLLWRPELEVNILRLTRAEYLWLLLLSMGTGLEGSAAHALREDAAFDLKAVLAKHLTFGTFCSFERILCQEAGVHECVGLE